MIQKWIILFSQKYKNNLKTEEKTTKKSNWFGKNMPITSIWTFNNRTVI